MKKITKVVIPVAGKGTRFLPITKTISKTLLPIIDKPVIQYLIEEAINAKIEEALIIIGPNQKDVIDYFDTNSEYVKNLNGKVYKEIEEIKNIETSADTVIFDGIISQRLVDVASLKGIKRLVAFRSMNIVKKPDNLKIITMD